MKTYETYKKELVEAFGHRACPPSSRITTCRDPESNDIAKSLSGKKWDQLSYEMVNGLYCDLPILTPESFAYYLPAYILASIKEAFDHGNYPGTVGQFTLMALLPEGRRRPESRKTMETHLSCLSEQEKKVVRQYLSEMADLMGDDETAYLIRESLDGYWR